MIEVLLVIVVAGILMTMGVPKSSTTLENAGVNKAVADMQSIWLSQRRYRMEYGTFAPSMKALVQEGFLHQTFLKKRDPFEYKILAKSRGRLKIRAIRAGGGSWGGSLTLDEMGDIEGKITDGRGQSIEP
ncbi:MAG: hypothetical protein COA70_05615 [Planctomycetota bacterium]|nr:MAG: hypothetical protein COA70_05615 [Planctomycetota bacterium]